MESNTEGSDPTWFPYPSKLALLLDTIDNLPRLRISASFMKVLLWLLREVGVRDVPSFDGLKKIQKNLEMKKIVPTIHWKSPKGHTFSFNDPRAIVANVSNILDFRSLKYSLTCLKRTGPTLLSQSTSVAIQSFHKMGSFRKSGMVKNGAMTLTVT